MRTAKRTICQPLGFARCSSPHRYPFGYGPDTCDILLPSPPAAAAQCVSLHSDNLRYCERVATCSSHERAAAWAVSFAPGTLETWPIN